MRLTAGWGRTVGLTIHPRLILAATVLGLCVHPSVSAAQTPSESDSSTVVQSYDDALETIHEARQALLLRYQNADSDSARMLVLGEAKRQLVSFVRDDLAPFWYGTPWAFNGLWLLCNYNAQGCRRNSEPGSPGSTSVREDHQDLGGAEIDQTLQQCIAGNLS